MSGSTIDFTTYTDAQLEEGRISINPGKYPENFAALAAEMDRRKAAGLWNPALTRAAAEGALPPIAADARELGFTFLGSGREYFPIWVTNFFLCVITLGLFTPWAKVRTRRYFYSRIRLAGASFSYAGRPLNILAGRLLLFAIIAFMFINSILGFLRLSTILIVVGFTLLAVPWILWKSARFNFANTSYRGIGFHLDASLLDFYVWALKQALLSVVTLGIATGMIGYQYRVFLLRNLRFGETKLAYTGTLGGYFKKVFPAVLAAGVITFVISMIAVFVLRIFGDNITQIGGNALGWLSLIVYWAVTDAVATTHISEHLSLGDIRFRSRIDKIELAQAYASAAILTAVTLGFGWPWARTGVLRYKLERVTLHAPTDAENNFTQTARAEGRTGGFATEFFEFELGI